MSTLAMWLFAVAALMLLVAVAMVALAVRSVLRKGRRLVGELDSLQEAVPVRGHAEYSGYHRRVSSRQEEVDHG